MSYGMPLLGLLALAVLVAARSWRPLPVAAGAALAVVLASRRRASRGGRPTRCCASATTTASPRTGPTSYWWWGNLAALVVCAGPLLGAGLARHLRRARADRVVAAAGRRRRSLMVALADASGMSKAEVERIWLPFVPWLTLSLRAAARPLAAVGAGGSRWSAALVVQHLLYTTW